MFPRRAHRSQTLWERHSRDSVTIHDVVVKTVIENIQRTGGTRSSIKKDRSFLSERASAEPDFHDSVVIVPHF